MWYNKTSLNTLLNADLQIALLNQLISLVYEFE